MKNMKWRPVKQNQNKLSIKMVGEKVCSQQLVNAYVKKFACEKENID